MTGTVLLTGATGFVGRHILSALAVHGVAVRAVVRAGGQHHLPCVDTIERVIETPDLFAETASWWQKTCEGTEITLHAAWYAEPGKYLHSPVNLDCLAGTLQLAKGAVAAGVRRMVGVGTCFEYDVSAGTLSVDTPLKPETPYAAAKAAAYLALSQWLPTQGVRFAWCRLFYLYGDGEDPRRLVPQLRSRISKGEPVDLTSGMQVRDFLDVAEAGRRIAAFALCDLEGALNVCSGIPITIRQLAERIADEYGRRDLLRFGVRSNNAFDPPYIVGISSGSPRLHDTP